MKIEGLAARGGARRSSRPGARPLCSATGALLRPFVFAPALVLKSALEPGLPGLAVGLSENAVAGPSAAKTESVPRWRRAIPRLPSADSGPKEWPRGSLLFVGIVQPAY